MMAPASQQVSQAVKAWQKHVLHVLHVFARLANASTTYVESYEWQALCQSSAWCFGLEAPKSSCGIFERSESNTVCVPKFQATSNVKWLPQQDSFFTGQPQHVGSNAHMRLTADSTSQEQKCCCSSLLTQQCRLSSKLPMRTHNKIRLPMCDRY